jgi:peroxiredoxin
MICVAILCLFLSTFASAEKNVEYAPFTSIEGETIKAETLNNSPVVLSFMAHWCQSCRAEAVVLQKSYMTYRDQGILFIGLFIKSSEKGIKTFAQHNGITFPVGKDTGLARQLGVWSVPVTYIIAKEGKIKKRYFGRISQSVIRLGIEEIQK